MKKMLSALAFAAYALLASLPAAAGALTDYGENKSLDALLRGQSLGAPATFHLGLTTDACSDSGAGTEPTAGAYSRVAVPSSLASWAGTQGAGTTTVSSGTSATTSNNALIAFPESTAAWGNLQAVRWYDASTAGNAWICIDLTLSLNVDRAGVTVKFNAGTLQFYVDD